MTSNPPNGSDKRLTRRQWLLLGGGGAAALTLGGGAWLTRRWGLVDSALAAPRTMRDHRVAALDGRALAIVRGSSASKNLRAALDAVGGLRHFLAPGDRVLIKPNIAWDRRPEQGATTHPEVVAELVLHCRDLGIKELRVLDCPVDDPTRTYHRTGIAAAARNAGATVLLPSQSDYVQVQLPGQSLAWPIRDAFLWADKIINVPVAKHHGSTQLTAGMKNWIGITDKRRELFHRSIHESIVGLAEFVKPTLTIIDATRVLMRNGPRGGNLDDVKTLNTLIACVDPVAGDACACDLLGFPRDKVAYLKLAEDRGLGTVDWRKLSPKELQLG
jgi:uncharacterized protein (DUF362 family)